MAKKAIMWLVFIFLLATGAASAAGTESGQAGQAAFAGGVQQAMPDITSTRIKVARSVVGQKPPYEKTVAIAYHFEFFDGFGDNDIGGRYLYGVVNRADENKTVYGSGEWSGHISFELPAILSTDIDMYWVGDYRVIFDKEKNIVMTLAATPFDADMQVAAYQVSGFALRDMAYLGAYRTRGQTKLIVGDAFRAYVVDAGTMRNEREYNLQGLKPVGVNIGLHLEKSNSRFGVWLTSCDNKALHYLDLTTGGIRLEADLAEYNIDGEFVKMVSGWSGYITGGYGGVFLVKDNQTYSLYDSRFKRKVDKYPYGGKALGDVKDIFWTIMHGVRTRAAVVVIEKEGPYIVSDIIGAKEFFE